jgi:hypothetical protein
MRPGTFLPGSGQRAHVQPRAVSTGLAATGWPTLQGKHPAPCLFLPGRHRRWRARNPRPSTGGYGFRARRGACHRAGRRPDPVAAPRNDATYDSNFEITERDTVSSNQERNLLRHRRARPVPPSLPLPGKRRVARGWHKCLIVGMAGTNPATTLSKWLNMTGTL